MQYRVTYTYQGDEAFLDFNCVSSALEFIKENLNYDSHGDFRIFAEVSFDISVGLSVN